ncbi:MAG: alpha/beta fold hydrolase [Bacteroidetes bacterium]|nr:alpha/beta fold hydrolase [Fibrella sp.]
MKLFYREVGDPADPAILILHGIFGSSDNWLTVSKAIAEQGYRVLLVDQRNHGHSPRSAEFDYPAMAADLHELLLDLGLDKPVLIGHSMGGKTVMHYAVAYPGTFAKLVIVDIAPKSYPIHHAEIIRGLKAIDLAKLKSRNEADAILSQYEPSLAVRQFLLKNLFRNEQNQFDWRLNLPVIEQELEGIGSELLSEQPVAEPTLFIRGARSNYIRETDYPRIQQLFPDVTIQTIADAGHWVQAEKPAEFVAVLMKFLTPG